MLQRDEVMWVDIGTKKQYVVKGGEFIISKIDARNGAFGIVPESLKWAIITWDFLAYDINTELVDMDFFLAFISLNNFEKICAQASSGTTNRQRLSEPKFLNFQIQIPWTLWDQKEMMKKYAEYKKWFSELKNLSEENEKLIKSLKSSILQDAIQWKLVPQDPSDEPASILIEKIQVEKTKLIAEWKIKKQKPLPPINLEEIPYELPKGWEWVRFGQIVSIESNLVNPSEYPNFPHIAPDNIEKNTGKLLSYRTVIEDEINSSNHLFKSWHILYSKVRPKLNKVVIVDFEGLCSADMYPIRSFINKYYLKNMMLSDMFLDQIDAYDNRVKMPKINQDDLSLILIPVPSEKEQTRIVEKSNELMKSCELLDEQIRQAKDRSEKLMESVLQGVFNQ